MNRNPSTTIPAVKPSGILPPIGPRRAVFQEVFAAGKAAFPAVEGLVYIDRSRAFFQIHGDATPYSVAITRDESDALGYMTFGEG